MGAFAYSQEEGTPAERLGDPVPEDEKQRRLAEIMELQDGIAMDKNSRLVGQTMRVLIDRIEGRYYIGRSQADSPEVDDEVIITVGRKAAPRIGDFCDVCVTQAFEHDVMAEIC